MESGDPNASSHKRARKEGGPLYSALPLPPPGPQQQPINRHSILPAAASPTNHYPPQTLPPPTQSYQPLPQPPPASVTPFDSRSLSDPSRALPAPPHLNQRPSHATPVTLPPRSYSQDSYAPRPPGTPSQPPPPDHHRRSITSGDGNYPSMDHGGPQPMYMATEHHHNGSIPNGYAMAPPHEQYAQPPVATNQAYNPVSVNPYPAQYGQGPIQHPPGQQRRKQVRASQACDHCRTRKQKCDESRPCATCSEQGLQCKYRDVPPPKQDRTMMQVLDSMNRVVDRLDGLSTRLDSLERRLPKREASSSTVVSPVQPIVSPGHMVSPGQPAVSNGQPPSTVLSDSGDIRRESVDTHKASSEYSARVPTPAVMTPATTTPVPTHLLMRHESSAGLPIKQESFAHPVDHHQGDTDDEKTKEIALPADHETAAHQLLEVWGSMGDFYANVNDRVKNPNYPMVEEERRGLLRIYGRGQGADLNDGSRNPPASPAGSNGGDQPSPSPTPREGLWGTGLDAAPSPADIRRSNPSTPGGLSADDFSKGSPGGLNPDGTLKLDVATVRSLHKSYLENIDILHPFLDKGRLSKMIERFTQWYSPDGGNYPSSGDAVPGHVLGVERHAGTKRKRSGGQTDFPSILENHNTSYEKRPIPERSIGNAIILLVLALGKVCEHKKALPGPVKDIPNPSDLGRPSPGSSNTTIGASPPYDDGLRQGQKYYHHSSIESVAERKETSARNIDMLPGLAYYAYATDILGNLHGGNEVSHAQAFVLAGLYMGQYARVLESWSWIHTACRVISIQVKKEEMNLGMNVPGPFPKDKTDIYRLNLLKFVFWTCLQLESDILAEMSRLPPSGISMYQSRVSYPSAVYDELPAEIPPDDDVKMVYYSAQIHLRTILNDAHKLLYSYKKENKAVNLSWAGSVPSILEEQLQAWRNNLPPSMSWDDADPPSTDINTARMRAKYYGARYIISRPFLYFAVHKMDMPPGMAADGSQQSSPTMPLGLDAMTPKQRELMDLAPEQSRMKEIAGRCVNAAIQSTIAFDRVGVDPKIPWKIGWDHMPERFIVTNIFGTAHAQFGNMLVLAAVYRSRLKELVSFEILDALLTRTIKFLRRLAPNSPTLKLDADILANTQIVIKESTQPKERRAGSRTNSRPMSASVSFES
ncbi:hypothetical protein K432DRAFT_218789 [Lepidopterella palustris CBS 459.81]|uniref:Zn(2)-C6 fungal-type domain-containing protein n=1 Tax=Lepidopterella palustris CBS 459.81 TaxID=1314670 RepID=A0A8E2DY60_9PEZI|nr:hypothetical protein K432DRAFT_218789 [Lepidopterella palustris CBS 459.81]